MTLTDFAIDIENCCSFLYICLWFFKYTKSSAVFILTLSLEMSDKPKKSAKNVVLTDF